MTSERNLHHAERAKAQFERHCAALDAATREALRSRRRALLAAPASARHTAWQRLIPAGAMATMVAIAGALWLAPAPTPVQPPTQPISREAALATAEESARALDDDPEFYLWLASAPIAGIESPSAAPFDKERTL